MQSHYNKPINYLPSKLVATFLIILFACKPHIGMPILTLLKSDSATIFTPDTLSNHEPTMLILFSPDCDHCQQLTQNILDSMNSLKKYNIIFATTDPIQRLKIFERHYRTDLYHNIYTGRDINFILPTTFKNASPPFIAVYDKNKALTNIFYGAPPINVLAKLF